MFRPRGGPRRLSVGGLPPLEVGEQGRVAAFRAEVPVLWAVRRDAGVARNIGGLLARILVSGRELVEGAAVFPVGT